MRVRRNVVQRIDAYNIYGKAFSRSPEDEIEVVDRLLRYIVFGREKQHDTVRRYDLTGKQQMNTSLAAGVVSELLSVVGD